MRDGRLVEGLAEAVRAWPVKIESGKVWVAGQALLLQAQAS
ncbi:Nitrite reductase [NAD(P)H] large subunit [Cronobacter muytjensii 530]